MADIPRQTNIPVPDPLMLEALRGEGRKLYEEFRRKPVGKHTPNLQFILQLFRGSPVAGKYALVAIEPHRKWMLAELTGTRGHAVAVQENVVFTDLASAECMVYRLRWQHLMGETVDP